MFSFLTTFTRPVNALRGVLAAFLCLSLATCASAQVGFTFNNPNLTATSGTDIVFYDGTLTNGVQPSSLLGFGINFDIPNAVDSSPFADYLNNNAPDPLPANYAYNLTPFVITVPNGVANGVYNGTFTLNYLTGGVESSAVQNFSLTVVQTPGFGFTFNHPFQSVGVGTSSLTFDAVLDNGSTETMIDGYSFSFDGASDGLTIDSSLFESYLNNNDSIAPSSSFGQSLFTVNVSGAAVPGEYGGTATISYTTNGISNTAVQNFSLIVTQTQTADFGFTFNKPIQSVSAGTSPALFDGVLNNGPAETVIDGYNFSFDNVLDGLTIDSSPFDSYLNNNGSIPSSAILGQSFFAVNVSKSVAPGEYGGTASISYTTNGISNTVIHNFTVLVTGSITTTAPEPATLMLMLIGTMLTGIGIACRKIANFWTSPLK